MARVRELLGIVTGSTWANAGSRAREPRARPGFMYAMKKQFLLLVLIFIATATVTWAQIAPPYLTTISPTGARRGGKAVLTVEGYNLTDASEILWNRPGISGSILLNSEVAREQPRPSNDPTKKFEGDRATRNRLQIEINVTPEAELGIYSFRLKTPLGTSSLGRIYISGLRETAEKEMNDSLADAQSLMLPTTVVGEMQRKGDNDYFKFKAKVGQQIVCNVVASGFGSKLDSVLTLFDDQGRLLAHNNDYTGQRDALLAYTIKADGEYALRVTDLQKDGQPAMSAQLQYAYRLNIGELPFLTDVFPLGVKQAATSEMAVSGFNLGVSKTTVKAPANANWNDSIALNLVTTQGQTYNTARLAIGRAPEIVESSADKTLAVPQSVTLPVTINGRIWNGPDWNGSDTTPARPGQDFYRFTARKGQPLILEVEAQRYGSPLDAVIEIYDAAGKLVPRALLRCLLETQQTLNDRDSASRGIRLLSWNGINVNDYLLIGNELLQVDALPKGPDEDTFFKSFAGQRLGFLDTTPEAHAANTSLYKVSIHPPDAQLSSNGLPVVTLYYRNDDGGPMYGKDSRLSFTAPADGSYTVRIRDVRGMQGERFAYRLTIRQPAPDFVLSVDPENPNVPRGAALPLTVTAFRTEGFDSDIEVKLLDLPNGFTATRGTIRAGMNSTVLLLLADPTVSPALSFPLCVQGVATANAQQIVRDWKTAEKIAVVSGAAPPELLVWAEQPRVVIEPGGTSWLSIKIKREQGFQGRVPFDIRNLPPGVIVKDAGLNGVLITEEQETQRFELSAEPWVQAMEHPIFVVGRIETASPQRSDFPAKPLTLVIQPKQNKGRAGQ